MKKYVFKNKFKVDFPDREDRMNDLVKMEQATEQWYVDGSKTEAGTGCGVHLDNVCFGQQPISQSMGSYATAYQAEVVAINICVDVSLERNNTNKTIFINSDSKAALMSLYKSEFTFKITYETVLKLNELS